MVWENMDTGKKVQGVVGRTRGLIVTWIWEGRSFSSFAHVCMDCVAAGVPPDGGELGELFPLQGGKAVSRSEEHTSELKSLMRITYAVLCLKKKTEKIKEI